jgi:hypothetical protein
MATTTKPPSPGNGGSREGRSRYSHRFQGTQLYDQFVRTLWHTERSIYNTFTVAKLMMSDYVQSGRLQGGDYGGRV